MPAAPTLPAGSTTGFSYEYGVDANLGTVAEPSWQSIRRITEVAPTSEPVRQSAQTYDDFGAERSEISARSVTLTFQVLMTRSTSTGLYTPEVEALLARARPDAIGVAAVIEARWYHKPATGTANPTDAGQGFFAVSASRTNIGADGASEFKTFTLSGQGTATPIANPFAGWAVTSPVITSAAPAGASTGQLVTLQGRHFAGATAVTIDGTAADFAVVGDGTLVVALPTGSAGSVPIIVTTPGGASAALSYTRA